MKKIAFAGSSLADLRGFPLSIRQDIGYQLELVQKGKMPFDWKPMPAIGTGVREVRVKDPAGIFRVIYLAKLEEAIYVLHCFQKKSQTTSHQDIELAKQRYKTLIKEYSK